MTGTGAPAAGPLTTTTTPAAGPLTTTTTTTTTATASALTFEVDSHIIGVHEAERVLGQHYAGGEQSLAQRIHDNPGDSHTIVRDAFHWIALHLEDVGELCIALFRYSEKKRLWEGDAGGAKSTTDLIQQLDSVSQTQIWHGLKLGSSTTHRIDLMKRNIARRWGEQWWERIKARFGKDSPRQTRPGVQALNAASKQMSLEDALHHWASARDRRREGRASTTRRLTPADLRLDNLTSGRGTRAGQSDGVTTRSTTARHTHFGASSAEGSAEDSEEDSEEDSDQDATADDPTNDGDAARAGEGAENESAATNTRTRTRAAATRSSVVTTTFNIRRAADASGCESGRMAGLLRDTLRLVNDMDPPLACCDDCRRKAITVINLVGKIFDKH